MGYEATASFLAVERGEVDGACTTYETLGSDRARLARREQGGVPSPSSARTPLPELPQVPMGLRAHPRQTEDLKAVRLVAAAAGIRPALCCTTQPAARPASPPLRDAFAATMKDPAYLSGSEEGGA